ncbi:MAG TPA: tripartite tricarboxylate transporter substrate binding protein [Pseudolabrys sp.]|nr:tripartite tricarboxylate transporter substrate binding protein [Pseudolabrys sp.]
MIRSRSIALLAGLFLLLAGVPAPADDGYPTRPIHLIVGFAAGSSADVAARTVSQKLGALLGQTVVVENHPGASGIVAAGYVARSKNDGYTLLVATIAATINTTLMPGKGPDLETDLAPIVLIGSLPDILVVTPKLNINSVAELIAFAKQKPDELHYGASGLGSGPHLASEMFKQMAGIKMTGVLYPGSAQTVTDLIAGRIQVMFAPASTVLGFIDAGTVKALATSQAKRASVAPDLPTIAEAGLPGFDTGLWFGILAPAGTAKPVIDRISAAANEALKDPEVVKALKTQGFDPIGGTPDEFARYIRSETARWAQVIRDMDSAQKKSN